MELAEMICLPALFTSPLKGRVIGFFGRGRGADVRVHFGSGVASFRYRGVRDGSLRRGVGYVSGLCES